MSQPAEPVLRTERLLLRPISTADSAELFASVVSQHEVMRWLATGKAGSRAEADTLCEQDCAHWAEHGYGQFAVRDLTSGEFYGRVGLRHRPEHGVDLGFALDPRCHGRGIAREAGVACLDWAFNQLGVPVVYGFVLPDNAASITLLRRLGAEDDGTVQSSGLHCLRFRFTPADHQ